MTCSKRQCNNGTTSDTPGVRAPRMKSIYITGILQIIGGSIIFLCGLILLIVKYQTGYRNRFDNSAVGMWAGGMVVGTGINGVLKSRQRCFLKYYLGMSLFSMVQVIVALVLSTVAAADNVHYYKEHPGYHDYDNPDYPDQHGVSLTKLGFHILLSLVSCMELIVCLLAAVFSCSEMGEKCAQGKAVYYKQPEPAPTAPPNYAYPPLTVKPQTAGHIA